MLTRIKWNEDFAKKLKKDETVKPNECVLIWEGLVRERSFGEVKYKMCPLVKQARELFEKHKVY
jgi:U4/U6 small nuclear ribonucleoprotein PRP3